MNSTIVHLAYDHSKIPGNPSRNDARRKNSTASYTVDFNEECFFFSNEDLFTGNAIEIVDIKLYLTDLKLVVSDSHMHI